MSMTETETDSGCTIKLPAVLDLEAAKGLLDALKRKSDSAKAVSIDAADVEVLALPCAQVLLAAVKSPSSISVVNHSDAFVGAFAELGIAWDNQPATQPADQPNTQTTDQPAAQPADQPAAQSTDQSVNVMDEPQPEIADGGGESEVPMNKRILTIDDSKTMRDMLMLTLQDSGFDVIQAVDGQDGIDVLAREKNVDVIITDINMPKMDGYGVLEHVRKNPIYDATPILVLTTESDTEKKERARGLGATGFIVKPFNPISLVEVIRKVSP